MNHRRSRTFEQTELLAYMRDAGRHTRQIRRQQHMFIGTCLVAVYDQHGSTCLAHDSLGCGSPEAVAEAPPIGSEND
jgi:hypothetical protein